jgi:hypothetical protein
MGAKAIVQPLPRSPEAGSGLLLLECARRCTAASNVNKRVAHSLVKIYTRC